MTLSFGEKIKESRKAKKFTQKELAALIGAKHNSISDWENDKNRPDPDTIELLCGVLDITPNYLLSTSTEDFSPAEKQIIESYRLLDAFGQETINIILNRELSRVQQLDCASRASFGKPAALRIYTYLNKIACAGSGFYFEDIPTDIVEAPYMESADFIIGVSGDSMEPTYCDGDLVYVEQRQVIDIGDIGIFFYNNECLIKEAGENGLISHNQKYALIPGTEDIRCIGRVLGKVPDRDDTNADNDSPFELHRVNKEFKKALESDMRKEETGKTG